MGESLKNGRTDLPVLVFSAAIVLKEDTRSQNMEHTHHSPVCMWARSGVREGVEVEGGRDAF